jgi:hypothetical protein
MTQNKMTNKSEREMRFFQIIIISLSLITFSCNNYQNPGNNSGKTGDGTTMDSLASPKSDTGKGANLRNKLIKRENDSITKSKNK